VRRIFVDTSGFVALRNASEAEHDEARRAMTSLLRENVQLFTSNYIFAETYTALLVRAGRDEALNWGMTFRFGRAVEIVRADQEIEEEAWSILEDHGDKAWSYVDATSFALMAREDVDEAFALDRHFRQRGLRVIP
jgi:predicted nucleic acid-binding protein